MRANRNYTVTKCEAFGMIFLVQNLCHYHLEKKIVFYIDYDALKYMIDKLQLSKKLQDGNYLCKNLTL